MTSEKPRIGISACLLGAPVRFDGGHKLEKWLVNELGKWVDWEPLCPEMEMGLGTPRESLRLVLRGNRTHLVGNQTETDLTELAKSTFEKLTDHLPDLDGYILKKNSPSCGFEKVKVYSEKKTPVSNGAGLFAARLKSEHPELPIIEEGRLSDLDQREHFVTRIFAFYRWKQVPAKISGIQKFHQTYKLLLMAHSPAKYLLLGKLAANSKKAPVKELRENYGRLFLEALSEPSSTKKRVNVLQHVWGYFKKELSQKEREGILEIIEDFRKEELTFIAALTCVKQLLNRISVPYLEEQFFFSPYPKAISLRKYL